MKLMNQTTFALIAILMLCATSQGFVAHRSIAEPSSVGQIRSRPITTDDAVVDSHSHHLHHGGFQRRTSPLHASVQRQNAEKTDRRQHPERRNHQNKHKNNHSHQSPASSSDSRHRSNNHGRNQKEYVNRATLDFNGKLNQLSKAYDRKTAPKVQKMLDEALDAYQRAVETGLVAAITPNHDGKYRGKHHESDVKSQLVQPNAVSCTAVLNAWSRCSRPDAPEKAQELLERMLELSGEIGYKELTPNAFAFYAVLSAWNRCQRSDAGERAIEVLRLLQQKYEERPIEEFKPTARAYNMVINVVARSRQPNCAGKAVALLNEMEQLHTEGDRDMQPNAVSFGAIINAYAHEQDPASVEQAIQMLQRMASLYQLGYESVRPNTFVYNSCMNAFAKIAGKPSTDIIHEAADNSEDGHATPGSPVTAESSSASSDDSNYAEKANDILEWMEEQYFVQNNNHVKPSVISYSTVINAYANSKCLVNAGPASSVLFQRMVENHVLSGDEEWRPNAIVVDAVLRAWLTTIDAVKTEAEKGGLDDHQELFAEASSQCRSMLTQTFMLYHHGERRNKSAKMMLDAALVLVTSIDDADGIAFVSKLQRSIA